MYLYQWQGTPDNGFDSGLLGYDGSPRPAYGVVAAQAGPARRAARIRRRDSPAPAAGAAIATAANAVRRHAAARTGAAPARRRAASRCACAASCAAQPRCAAASCSWSASPALSSARFAVDVAAGRVFSRLVRLDRPRAPQHPARAPAARSAADVLARAGGGCTARSGRRGDEDARAVVRLVRQGVASGRPHGSHASACTIHRGAGDEQDHGDRSHELCVRHPAGEPRAEQARPGSTRPRRSPRRPSRAPATGGARARPATADADAHADVRPRRRAAASRRRT